MSHGIDDFDPLVRRVRHIGRTQLDRLRLTNPREIVESVDEWEEHFGYLDYVEVAQSQHRRRSQLRRMEQATRREEEE